MSVIKTGEGKIASNLTVLSGGEAAEVGTATLIEVTMEPKVGRESRLAL